MKKLKGIPVSGGVGKGRAHIISKGTFPIFSRLNISSKEVPAEIQRFRKAVKMTEFQLKKLIEELDPNLGKDGIYILEAHLMILNDKSFKNKVEEIITKKKLSAERALHFTVEKLKKALSHVDDPYFREKRTDIDYVAERIAENLKGEEKKENLPSGPVILVGVDLSPADTVKFRKGNEIKGVILELGSYTSHPAIVLRALQIPAVVGIHNPSEKIKEGDEVIVDGTEGVVIVNPSSREIEKYKKRIEDYANYLKSLDTLTYSKALTADGTRIFLFGNVEFEEEIDTLIKVGADGIGLYRTEYLYLEKNKLPTEKDHYQNYRKLVEKLKDKIVTIRTLDIGGDKFLSEIPLEKHLNPSLGLRAIRLCLHRRDIFEKQIRGILRAGYGARVRILIPLITELGEVIETLKIIEEQKDFLRRKKISFNPHVEVGVMMETPSACLIADSIAPLVNFMSIGTNDLTQYTLAIDRTNDAVSYLYQPLHPAVIKLMEGVIMAGKNAGCEVEVCGEIAGDPKYIPVLIGMGFRRLSMAPPFIKRAKKIISELNVRDCRVLYDKIKSLKSIEEINAFLKEGLSKLTSNALLF